MSEQTNIGELAVETANRDAIHVACAPVVACERIYPGQHIGFTKNGNPEVSTTSANLIGIVDPFLKGPVHPGQRFWMLLYPKTITGLRHEWSHPAFTEQSGSADARLALQVIAERCGCSVDSLLERLDLYADGSCGDDDSIQETLNGLMDEEAVRNLWTHYERCRGVKVGEGIKRNTYFRCAC